MSITLNSKVYNFAGFDTQQLSNYVNRDAGIPTGFSRLTNRVDDGQGSANTKVRWKLKVPVVASVDSECSCIGALLRDYTVDIVVTVPPGSTSAERTDLQTRITDLVASPEFSGSITNLIQSNA